MRQIQMRMMFLTALAVAVFGWGTRHVVGRVAPPSLSPVPLSQRTHRLSNRLRR